MLSLIVMFARKYWLAIPVALSVAIILTGLAAVDLVSGREAWRGPTSIEVFRHRQRVAAARAAYLETRGPEETSAYAAALLSIGDYRGVLRLIESADAVFADEAARDVIEAEAALRLGRLDNARAALSGVDGGSIDDPGVSLLRARIVYAESPLRTEEANRRLRGALASNDPRIKREAWLFRARLALDANDLDAARAAANRALEAGAQQWSIDAIRAEAQIRDNAPSTPVMDKYGARGATDETTTRRARAEHRLAAMALLRKGSPRAAASRLDAAHAFGAYTDDRAELLRALAKAAAGDLLQADRLLTAALGAAPDDWVAYDLKLIVAGLRLDAGAIDQGAVNAALAALEAKNPALGQLRRAAMAKAEGRARDRFEALCRAFDASGDGRQAPSAQAFLIGDDFVAPRSVPQVRRADIALLNVAAASAGRSLDAGEGAPLAFEDAAAQTFFGDVAWRQGRRRDALEAWERAAALSSDFARPALRLAHARLAAGRADEAVRILQTALDRGPTPDEAQKLRRGAAIVLARTGDLAGAAAALLDDANWTPRRDGAAFFIIDAMKRMGVGAEAAAFARAAANRRTPNAVRGSLLLESGGYKAAASALRSVLIADPDDKRAATDYRAAMQALDRLLEADAFLSALPPMAVAEKEPDLEADACADVAILDALIG